jgi:HSP20 family molecular chaperone IbpA
MSALREALRDLPDAVFADVLESDDAYLLVIDLPGVTSATVDVTVEGGRLRVEGRREKDHPPEFRYLQEDRSLFLDAELPLPPDATRERAEAVVDRGVLEVTLPKRGATPPTTIEIVDRSDGDGNGNGNDDGDNDNDNNDDGEADGDGSAV